ncbi:hypothetical protein C8R43DRAFT_957764 [Mycena crocata]|nr:hypothetical protein C8R43DRAFT_957764 [Mycena crocata]
MGPWDGFELLRTPGGGSLRQFKAVRIHDNSGGKPESVISEDVRREIGIGRRVSLCIGIAWGSSKLRTPLNLVLSLTWVLSSFGFLVNPAAAANCSAPSRWVSEAEKWFKGSEGSLNRGTPSNSRGGFKPHG